MATNFVQGNLTRVFFGILSSEALSADTVEAPANALVTVDNISNVAAGSVAIACDALADPIPAGTVLNFGAVVSVTLAAAAALGAKTLTVTALPSALSAGSLIYFPTSDVVAVLTKSASSSATTLYCKQLTGAIADEEVGTGVNASTAVKTYTTAHAETGDTSISVRATTASITDAHAAIHQGLILMQGGTSADDSIDTGTTETTTFGDELSYSSAVATSASFSVSYNFNVLPTDDSFYRLSYAAENALGGVNCWVKIIDPAAAGSTTGKTVEGQVIVTGFSQSRPADGTITGSCTFQGVGTPEFTPAA